MKKILLLTLFAAGITATAQVKVGTNPTVLATDANLQVEGTTTAEQFVVLKNGNVGIGTTTPATKLSVLRGANGEVGPIVTASAPVFSLGREGTGGTKWPLNATFDLGTYATGVNSQSQLDIKLANGGVATPDVTVMSLLGNGNVGIGTTTPGAKLEVNGFIKVGSSDTTGDVTPSAGMIKFNSATSKFQGFDGTAWVDLH